MKKKTNEMIEKAKANGYTLLQSCFPGTYDDAYSEEFEAFRAKGYDVKSWLLKDEEGSAGYVIYGREKSPRGRKPVAKKVETVDYSVLTVKQLQSICKEKSIKGYGKMKKDQMIAVLQAI